MASYLAKRAARQQASSLLEPLIESCDDEDDNSEVETVKQSPMQKLKSTAVYFALAAAVGLSAAAMVLSPSTLMFVAGGICCANVPYSAYKEDALSKIPSLRSLNNALRQDANRMSQEVDRLSEEIDALKPEANRAAAIEQELRGIAETQQYNVDKLVNLVKENAEILQKMKDNLKKRILQDVIKIVVGSDRDGDNSISRKELKILCLKIRFQVDTYGVVFDNDKFVQLIGKEPTCGFVVDTVKKALKLNHDDEHQDLDVFHIKAEQAEGSKKEPKSLGDPAAKIGPTKESIEASKSLEATGGESSQKETARKGLFSDEESEEEVDERVTRQRRQRHSVSTSAPTKADSSDPTVKMRRSSSSKSHRETPVGESHSRGEIQRRSSSTLKSKPSDEKQRRHSSIGTSKPSKSSDGRVSMAEEQGGKRSHRLKISFFSGGSIGSRGSKESKRSVNSPSSKGSTPSKESKQSNVASPSSKGSSRSKESKRSVNSPSSKGSSRSGGDKKSGHQSRDSSSAKDSTSKKASRHN